MKIKKKKTLHKEEKYNVETINNKNEEFGNNFTSD